MSTKIAAMTELADEGAVTIAQNLTTITITNDAFVAPRTVFTGPPTNPPSPPPAWWADALIPLDDIEPVAGPPIAVGS